MEENIETQEDGMEHHIREGMLDKYGNAYDPDEHLPKMTKGGRWCHRPGRKTKFQQEIGGDEDPPTLDAVGGSKVKCSYCGHVFPAKIGRRSGDRITIYCRGCGTSFNTTERRLMQELKRANEQGRQASVKSTPR